MSERGNCTGKDRCMMIKKVAKYLSVEIYAVYYRKINTIVYNANSTGNIIIIK